MAKPIVFRPLLAYPLSKQARRVRCYIGCSVSWIKGSMTDLMQRLYDRLDARIFKPDKVSDKPSTSRWSILQISSSFASFLVSMAVAIFAVSLVFFIEGGVVMVIIGSVIAFIALIALLFGIYVFGYVLHLTVKWIKEGPKDITATSTDISNLETHIDSKLGELISAIGKQAEAVQANTNAVSELVEEIRKDKKRRALKRK